MKTYRVVWQDRVEHVVRILQYRFIEAWIIYVYFEEGGLTFGCKQVGV